MKAIKAKDARQLKDIPNIGPAMVRDFGLLGIQTPVDLINQSPFELYKKICKVTGTRKDPCVLDTYMAAIDFMNGAPARQWFFYTKKRKKEFPDI